MRKILITWFLVLLSAPLVFSAPCLSGWQYTKPVLINNTGGSAQTNYQILVSFNSKQLVNDSKTHINGNDIRFLDRNGNQIAFWIENGTFNTTKTNIWVKVPSIGANMVDTIFMYYGQSSANNQSDGDATFELFDDFTSSTINASKWSTCNTGSISVASGMVTLSTTGNQGSVLSSVSAFNSPIETIIGVNDASNGKSFVGQIESTSSNGYALLFDANGASTTMEMRKLASGAPCYAHSTVGSQQLSGSINGAWKFSWLASSNQKSNWPGGNFSRTDNSYSLPAATKMVFGNIAETGDVEVDWAAVRKSSTLDPTISVGDEGYLLVSATANSNSPVCKGNGLNLYTDSVPGANFKWTGPNGFTSTLQNPSIANAQTGMSGNYTVSITTACQSKTYSTSVLINSTSNAGIIAGDGCKNSGTLVTNGSVGNIVRWEYSTTGQSPWITVTDTTTSLNFSDLTLNTYYRVVAKNGVCTEALSDSVRIDVFNSSNGGNLSGAKDECDDKNSGTLTVSNAYGSILRWELSSDKGINWGSIANNKSTNPYSNLTDSTWYRAVIKNGVCSEQFSDTATINVSPKSVGGVLTGAKAVCATGHLDSLELTNNTGNVIRWESSLSGNSPWQVINNITEKQTYKNLTQTTFYRAIVKSGACDTAVSSIAQIRVDNKSDAGNIIGESDACTATNSGFLETEAGVGSVLKWQSSTDKLSFTDITNTSTINAYSNLNATTFFLSSTVCFNSSIRSSFFIFIFSRASIDNNSLTDIKSCFEGL